MNAPNTADRILYSDSIDKLTKAEAAEILALWEEDDPYVREIIICGIEQPAITIVRLVHKAQRSPQIPSTPNQIQIEAYINFMLDNRASVEVASHILYNFQSLEKAIHFIQNFYLS